jgi:hypothetical protein
LSIQVIFKTQQLFKVTQISQVALLETIHNNTRLAKLSANDWRCRTPESYPS